VGPSYPNSNVVFDKNGNLYGTTYYGETNHTCDGVSCGVLYEMTSSARGWTFSVLLNFGLARGENPCGNLVIDDQGNLYGTTEGGGPTFQGVAFEASPGATGWTEAVLHAFGADMDDGVGPLAGLARDSRGNLYGSTAGGGEPDCNSYDCAGTVFALTSAADGSWKETILHRFPGGTDGAVPMAGVTLKEGNLFGVTAFGGSNNAGVAFELSKP
jgi:hypothetical protein